MKSTVTVYEFASERADVDALLAPDSESYLWGDFVRDVHKVHGFSPWCYEAQVTTVSPQLVEYWRDQYEQALEGPRGQDKC